MVGILLLEKWVWGTGINWADRCGTRYFESEL